MPHRGSLRASDADRDLVAERLRQATTEGRLRPDELEDRLGVALSARTYGELDVLVADLPTAGLERRGRSPLPRWLPPVVALAVAIPIAALIVVAVAFVLTGVFAAWAVWLFVGWWFLAGRRRGYAGRGLRGHPGPYGVRRTETWTDHWL
jgi:Domain of unknown function (DUF1707)